jgi:hypothetical protein
MSFSDSHHFRRMVAGACMVVGPVLALAASVVAPAFHIDAGDQLASVAANQDRFLVSMLISMLAIALLVVAALGLMHMLRERMTAYGHAGGALAIVGLLAYMAQAGFMLTQWQMVRDGVQASDVATVHGVTHSAATVVPLAIVPLLSAVGFVVLAAGLWRAHVVDWWMAAAMALGAVLIVLSGVAASMGLGIIGAAVFLGGVGAVGLMVLRESDADWEQTPEYQGFRPAMHMG